MTVARTLALVGVVALVAAGCGAKVTTKKVTTGSLTQAAPWPQVTPRVEFGSIRSFTPLGAGYKLRLDLHLLFESDKTGFAACADSHECAPGTKSFDDDTYDHDLKFVVTYYVPPTTPVGLVSFTTNPPPVVTARYFYGLAHGQNPRHVKVMASGADALKEFAFYVEVSPAFSPHHFESVIRLYQQFHP